MRMQSTAKGASASASPRSRRAVAAPAVASLRFFNPLKSSPPPPQKSSSLASRGSQQRGNARSSATSVERAEPGTASLVGGKPIINFHGVHHVALLVKNLERSLDFYQNILGLEINPDRPHSKLPYRGAWLWIGPEMIHLMELDNPDPLTGRPEHGGRDRHTCVGVTDIKPLVQRLEAAGVAYTMSKSGRPAVFFRDPDMNCLEVVEQELWR